jgi:hypothetical protein
MGAGSKYWDDLEVRPLAESEASLYVETFESYPRSFDPPGWLDTGEQNALSEEPSLFKTFELADGNVALGTSSTSANIHSHLVVDTSETWNSYELSGRMQVSSPAGGIGVTLYSDYPHSDSYYRLRRYQGNAFHLAPHPHGRSDASACEGSTMTDVMPTAYTWYRFRFQAFPEREGTRLRAKVWSNEEQEPSLWQINCLDSSDQAHRFGRPGIWSMGAGSKYWDDLEVRPLAESEASLYVETFGPESGRWEPGASTGTTWRCGRWLRARRPST